MRRAEARVQVRARAAVASLLVSVVWSLPLPGAVAMARPPVAPDDRIDSPDALRAFEARVREVAPKVRDCVVGIVVTDDLAVPRHGALQLRRRRQHGT